MHKKLIAIAVFCVCLAVLAGPVLAQRFEDTRAKQYIGNINTGNYHCINCEEAKKMAAADRVAYGSADEAVKAGCRPCPVCKPPLKD